jgi:hypothetical protein
LHAEIKIFVGGYNAGYLSFPEPAVNFTESKNVKKPLKNS